MKSVIGLFDTSSDAFAAQNELLAAGLSRDRISVVTSRKNRDYRSEFPPDKTEAGEGAGIGAVTGAVLGGALASLGLLAIPGVGPLLGAGALVTTLAGAGVGAVAGGLIGGLIGLGIPEHEAEVYEEGVLRGGVLVSVDAEDRDATRVAMILSQHNAVDIERRAQEWETTGWQRRHPAPPAGQSARPTSSGAPAAPTAAPFTSTSASGASTPSMAAQPGPVEPRSRGVERPAETGGKQTAGSAGGAAGQGVNRPTSARIYNP